MARFHQVDEVEVKRYEDKVELEITYTTSFGEQRNTFFVFGLDEEDEANKVAKAALDGTFEVEVVEE